MKVTNNKLNPSLAKPEANKTQKSENSAVSAFDPKIGGLKQDKNINGAGTVALSERAQLMQRAKDIAGKTTVDEAKVARLQKLIDEGKYKVDADAVADKLVDAHMDFPE